MKYFLKHFPERLIFVLVLFAVVPAWAAESPVWNLFKTRFLQEDGRVIDRMNQDLTHSEAVGYTLFFALSYDDRQTFEKVFVWMRDNLQKADDGLYGWKWGKDKSGEWHMLDMNNATDGDMWIAASLLLAGEKYQDKDYLDQGVALVKAIREHLVYTGNDGKLYLLPAKEGFVEDGKMTLNPSYLILHLFREFGRYDNEAYWNKVYRDSKQLLLKARFGRFSVHPDWLTVDLKDGAVLLPQEKSLFGFDAIRIPLFVQYARKKLNDGDLDLVLEGYRRLDQVYGSIGAVTAPLDLGANCLSLDPAPYGFRAIFSCVTTPDCINEQSSSESLRELEREKKNYYSFCLYLFTDILFR